MFPCKKLYFIHHIFRDEEEDKFSWKGHSDFAFTEDGIIVIYGPKIYPVAADIFLFW